MIETRTVRLDDPVVTPLLDGLALEYEVRYGATDEMQVVEPGAFEPPAGLFVVLVEDGVVVAGGGFRPLAEPGVCEVKRMWTAPSHRRRGMAWRVLGTLEERARSAGYRRLWLETGERQPEAFALYIRRGYRRIPPYGRYPHARAFELLLDGDDAEAPSPFPRQ